MSTVTRRAYFGLEDGTGDYLIVTIELSVHDLEVELDEITSVEHVNWAGLQHKNWDIDGDSFAKYRDRVEQFIGRFFVNDAGKIAHEIADSKPFVEAT